MNKRRLTLLLFAVLIVTVFSINVTVIGGGFLWDDYTLIVNNPKITTLKNIPDFFTKGFWENTQKQRKGGYYRPLILLSYAIDYQIYRLKPWGYHLTNLLVHLGVVALVFLLLFSLESDLMLSFASSLLFGISPFIKEPVGWISGRTDLFASFFIILSLFFLNRYLNNRKTSSLLFFYLSFILAMFSKESAFIFPALAIALILYRGKLKETLKELLVLIFIWAGLMGLSLFVSFNPGSLSPSRAYSFLPHTIKALGYYVFKILIPYNVPPVPDYPSIFNSPLLMIPGILFLITLFTFAYKPSKKFGFFTTAAFISLIPSFGPILLTSPTPVANRFAYLAAALLYPIIFIILRAALNEGWAIILILILAIPVAQNSLSMNNLYVSENNFWNRAYKMSPDSVVVSIDYGLNLISIGKYEEGLKVLSSVEKNRNVDVTSFILLQLGKSRAYLQMNRDHDAEKILNSLLEKYPFDLTEEAFDYLFYHYVFYGKIDNAEDLVNRLLKKEGKHPRLLVALARVKAIEGNYSDAEKLLQSAKSNGAKTSEMKPVENLIKRMKYLEELASKGNRKAEAALLYAKGNFTKSEEILSKLIEENPSDLMNFLFLFRLKMRQKRKNEAITALNFLIDNATDYRLVEEAFKSAWYEFSDAKLSAYILEKLLKKFPNQPKKKEKIMILQYIKEKLKGG